jgi:hypothetical protein
MKPVAIWIAVTVSVGGALAFFSYNAGFRAGVTATIRLERLQSDWNGSKAQTKDAIRRWVSKTSPRAMTGRFPYVMSFPDRNCIELKIEPGSVGGVPVYCYRVNSLTLLEEHSDVE